MCVWNISNKIWLTSHLSLLYVGASIGAWSVNNKIHWTSNLSFLYFGVSHSSECELVMDNISNITIFHLTLYCIEEIF